MSERVLQTHIPIGILVDGFSRRLLPLLLCGDRHYHGRLNNGTTKLVLHVTKTKPVTDGDVAD